MGIPANMSALFKYSTKHNGAVSQHPLTERTVIQNYVSRPDSLCCKLSQYTWQDGLDTFFTHQVPFSYSTSLNLANKYLNLIQAYYHNCDKEILHVVELGAGLGLLSFHICLLLEEQQHPLFKKIKFTITDSSDALVDSIHHHPLYNRYKEHVSWQAFDCLGDDYSLINQASVVIMNYVCDALATHHMEYNNNTLYEWNMATYFNNSDYFFDTQTFPPRFYKGTSLHDYLKNLTTTNFSTNPPKNLLRLSHLLKEDWKKNLAKDCFSKRNYDAISKFMQKTNIPAKQRFNFSFELDTVMRSILTNLQNNSLVLIYDFGIPKWTDNYLSKNLYYGQYGMNLFYTTNFTHLRYLADHYHYSNLMTQFKHGNSQLLALFNNNKALKSLEAAFTSHFSKPYKSPKLAKSLRGHVSWATYCSKYYKRLSDTEKYSYKILVSLAECLVQNNDLNAAEYYLTKLENHFGTFARSGFYLKAKMLNQQKRYDECVSFIHTRALTTCSHSGILYEYLVALCYSNNLSLFITTFKHYLTTTDYHIPWRFFLITLFILNSQNKADHASEIIKWLKSMIKEFPEVVPQTLHSEINAL